MTLQELLTSLQLTEEQTKQINSTVDALIASKVAVKDDEYKEQVGTLEQQLQTKNEELTTYKSKEQDAIKEKIGKTILGDKFEKSSKYVKFEEDFDFTNVEAITAKFEEFKNDFFPPTTDDPFIDGKTKVGGQEPVEEILDPQFNNIFDDQK